MQYFRIVGSEGARTIPVGARRGGGWGGEVAEYLSSVISRKTKGREKGREEEGGEEKDTTGTRR